MFILYAQSLSQVQFLRKSFGSRLNVFAPVQDLSALSKSGSECMTSVAGMPNDLALAGGQLLGDEYTDHGAYYISFLFCLFHFVDFHSVVVKVGIVSL